MTTFIFTVGRIPDLFAFIKTNKDQDEKINNMESLKRTVTLGGESYTAFYSYVGDFFNCEMEYDEMMQIYKLGISKLNEKLEYNEEEDEFYGVDNLGDLLGREFFVYGVDIEKTADGIINYVIDWDT